MTTIKKWWCILTHGAFFSLQHMGRFDSTGALRVRMLCTKCQRVWREVI